MIKDKTTLVIQPTDTKKHTVKVHTEEWPEWKAKGSVGPPPRRVLPGHPKLKGDRERARMAKPFLDHLDELSPLNEAEVLR
jgi:hypothetical protein